MRIVNFVATVAILAASIAAPARVAAADTADKMAILRALQESCDGFKIFNFSRAMSLYAPDLQSFDMSPPQQRSYADLKEALRQMIEAMAGPPTADTATCTSRSLAIMVAHITSCPFMYN
jgi:ketosteroid isomerase-like protein